MASGQAALPRLLDSAVISMPDARRLYLVNAVAGQDKGGRGDSVAAAFSSMPPPMSAGRIWYLGQWATVRKDTAHLAQLSGHAAVLRDESAAASDSLLASVLDAHLTLLRGDTSAAIRALSSLSSAVPLDWLVWDPWAALAAERVLLAELLLAHGEPGPSAAVAEVLDGSQSLAFLPFLRRTLVVRMRAMEQLGKKRDAALLKARLEALEANDARRAGSEPGRR
jgi:hypothetical protein